MNSSDSEASKPNVVAILYPGCIFFKIALAVELLADKYQIYYATPDGSDHKASNGSLLRAHSNYEQIDLENCRGILVPGGDPRSIKDNKSIDAVLQLANSKCILLSAICAGPSILAKASVLKGKRIAHGFNSEQLKFLKLYFEEVILTDEKFICDGNIITAKPEGHIDFAVEIACRLGAADASKANRTKDYYRGILGKKIRPLALALIRNPQNQFLFHKSYDKVKDESFYRPLGGGVEFSETGKSALEREIMEEISQEIIVSGQMVAFENIFTFEGHHGHEIIMLFTASFKDTQVYSKKELDIFESGIAISKAVWRSLAEIQAEGAKLYPKGLDEVIAGSA